MADAGELQVRFHETGGLDGEDLEHSKSEPRRVRLAKEKKGLPYQSARQ